MITHIYLSFRSYALKSDTFQESTLCQIGKNWDCDSALTSNFSEIFGLPISNFGFALNALCFFILLLIHIKWIERPNIWALWVWIISLGLALGSIVMFFISLIFLKTFCTLCTLCYLLSFAVLWPVKKSLPSLTPFKKEFSLYIKPLIWLIGSSFALVFLIQAVAQDRYNIRSLNNYAQSNFSDWKTTPTLTDLSEDKSFLASGPSRSEAKITLVEFADFLCPYCGRMYFSIKNFLKLNSQVRIEYMFFPLDPRGCDSSDSQGNENISAQCLLARSVYCAEEQKKGLNLQDFIYRNQNWFLSNRNRLDVENKVAEFLTTQNISLDNFQTCFKSAGNFIFEHRQLGQKLQITGTPSLFVEGKPIQPMSFNMTLNLILDSLE